MSLHAEKDEIFGEANVQKKKERPCSRQLSSLHAKKSFSRSGPTCRCYVTARKFDVVGEYPMETIHIRYERYLPNYIFRTHR